MMIGVKPCPIWLEPDYLLSQFGASREVAVEGYINFVREGVGLAPIWGALKRQVFLGDDTFVSAVQVYLDKQRGDFDEIPKLQRRAMAKPLKWYEENSESRNQAIVSAYASDGSRNPCIFK